jgi:hypothetical protein
MNILIRGSIGKTIGKVYEELRRPWRDERFGSGLRVGWRIQTRGNLKAR